MQRRWVVIFVSVLVLLSLRGALAHRAGQEGSEKPEKSSGMERVASVNMNRLYALSYAPQEYGKYADTLLNEAEKRLQNLSRVELLSAVQLQQYLDLTGKEMPSADDQQKIKDLQTLAEQHTAELQRLQGKASAELSAADKSRLTELADLQRTFTTQFLPNIAGSFRQETDAKMSGFRTEQMAKIRTVVGQVAKQKKFTHVFDVTVLIYCENDLTELVLQRLNKHSK